MSFGPSSLIQVLVDDDVTAITPHMFELTLRVFLRRKLLDALRGPWLSHDPEDAVVFQFVTGTSLHRDRGNSGGLSIAVHRQHRMTVYTVCMNELLLKSCAAGAHAESSWIFLMLFFLLLSSCSSDATVLNYTVAFYETSYCVGSLVFYYYY